MDSGRQPPHRTLTPAAVRFDGERPISLAHDDIYYDADGADEVARVFLRPANIAARFARCRGTFTICELGFGSGLNFMATLAEFLQQAPADAYLHFISVDAAPLGGDDLRRAARPWQNRLPYDQLLAAYPPLINGWHRRQFLAGRIRLSLYFGTALDAMEELRGRQRVPVDAFFLDGFAPAKNPDMWTSELLAKLPEFARNGTTVTTFSAAGVVKRGLTAAGFEVRRVDQRPHKRHSLLATYHGQAVQTSTPRRITVVGAGMAGAAVAAACAARGMTVTVLERGRHPASAASGIPAAVRHARLLGDGSAAAALRAHSYAFSVASQPRQTVHGALQLPGGTTSAAKLERLATALPDDWARMVSAADASALAGIRIEEQACHFPYSAVIDGRSYCELLLDSPSIEVRFDSDALCADSADPTVLACGANVRAFAALGDLELTELSGQVDRFQPLASPRLAVLGEGYIAPVDGSCWVGSTYEQRPWQASRASAANSDRLAKLTGEHGNQSVEQFRASRTVTSDRAPVVGALAGYYVSTGLGSAGTCYAPLAGEWLASVLCGEIPPVTRAIEQLCDPTRFAERQKRRPNPFRSR